MKRQGITYCIEGLNFAQFLSRASSVGIHFEGVFRQENRLTFTVSKKHTKNLLILLDQMCYTIVKSESRTGSDLRKNLLLRCGLLVGFIFSVYMLLYTGSFINSIQIRCDAVGSDSLRAVVAVQDYLQAQGIEEGVRKSAVDIDNLQDSIGKLDAVSAVNIELRGRQLTVTLLPATVEDASPDDGIGFDIIASQDCRVLEVTAVSGTPVVKPGDIVKAGTLLIEGKRLNPDGVSYDRVRAEGTVYAEIWLTHTETFFPEHIVYQRTGKSVSHKYLTVFGAAIPLSARQILFGSYETEQRYQVCTQGLLIPMRLWIETYFETRAETVASDFEEVRNELEGSALTRALRKAESSDIVLSQHNHVEKQSNFYTVQGIVKVKRKISMHN